MILRRNLKIVVVLVLSSGMLYYHLFLLRPASLSYWSAQGRGSGFYFGTDLYPLWLTSGEAVHKHGNPYSPEMTAQIQRGLFGHAMDPNNQDDPPPNYRTFSYPIFADYFLLPFSEVGFEKLRLAAVVILVLVTAGTVLLWLYALELRLSAGQKLAAIVLVLSSYYALEALYAEQIGILVGCFLAAAAWCVTRERFAWAGGWLALSTIKPQVSILLIAGMLIWAVSQWSKRRGLTIGFCAGMLGLWLSGEWLHRGWVPLWLDVLRHYGEYGAAPLTRLFFGRVGGLFLSVILCGAVLIGWWRVRRESASSARFEVAVAATLAVTAVALLPGQAVYDQIILLPAILLLIKGWQRVWHRSVLTRIAALLASLSLVWPWIAALGVSIAAVILSPDHIRHSIFALRLPLYPIYVFPFFLLALVWIARKEIAT